MTVSIIIALLGAILILQLVSVTFSTPAYACEVIGRPGPTNQEMLDHSAAVFSGKVIEIRKVSIGSLEQHAVLFEVDRYWKSPNPNESDENHYKQLVVFTGTSGNVCGYEFDFGETYLVHAAPWLQSTDADNSVLHTGLGYRNLPVADA